MVLPIKKIKLITYADPDVDMAFGNIEGIDKICCLSPLELYSIKDALLHRRNIHLLHPRIFEGSTDIPVDFIEKVFDSIEDRQTEEVFILVHFESSEMIFRILKEEIKFRGAYDIHVVCQKFHEKEPCHRAFVIGTKTVANQEVITLKDYTPEPGVIVEKIIPSPGFNGSITGPKIILN